ncbi:MAG: beta-lactamase family protein [Deltaproteobacteria bacterium]|nr:beta-lactamase family protein [Deltaproteobacteria bacterium]
MSANDKLMSLLEEARTACVTPGAVIAYGDREQTHELAFGHLDYRGGVPVTTETIYDIASLTKPVATVAVAMRMASDGRLDPEAPVRSVLPSLPEGIRFEHLLNHSAGYPAHIEFFNQILGRDELLEAAAAVELEREPGGESVYSDVGFILLGFALEELTGARLDELARELVTEPMGMSETQFVDCTGGQSHSESGRVAPTEDCRWRGGVVRGQVHDENAFAAGGICGHAGLFSTAPDLARFARSMVGIWNGAEQHGFVADAVGHFLEHTVAEGSSWRLGWDTPSGELGVSHAGDRWPRQASVGHLAFTGCSMWLHRPTGSYAIMLSNRVHPTRDNSGIRELRRAVMDQVAGALGLS